MVRFYGPKGILEASGGELRHIPQSSMDTAPSYYSGGFPVKDARPIRAPVARRKTSFRPAREALRETAVFQSDNWDDLRPHMWNFFQAVKTRGTVTEDAVFGNHAAIACHMANESLFPQAPGALGQRLA